MHASEPGPDKQSQETTMNWYRAISAMEKRTLRSCFAGWALDGVDAQLFSLVIPTLLLTWGIGKGQAGLIGGVTLVAGALGGLPAARSIFDRSVIFFEAVETIEEIQRLSAGESGRTRARCADTGCSSSTTTIAS
jgi:MFS family permease